MTKVQRYKVGYYTDEWGSIISPCLIPDDSGFAVKFEDYCKLETELAALKAELRGICAAIDDPACDLTLTAVECIKKLKAENDMDNTPEKRCCDECGRTGTDGGSTSESYCGACGATVPYPDEDLCPACGAENCMLIACPECGGRYPLDDGVWLHHSMDGRDAFETGERLPS